ncbi:MAG: SDR family NAD(P)-dependent oxidoreductase [Bdellovibrionota bacterium]
MKTANNLALVTGSSSGIGRAIALRLAKDGYDVLVHYGTREAQATETADRIKEMGGNAATIRFDVRDPKAVEVALDDFAKSHPDARFNVLVNNAGIHNDTLLGLMSDDAFDSVMKTNAYGPFFLMRWFVKKMMRQRQGIIVNISSLSGQTGNAGQINYAASKAALIAMTKSLAMEVGSRGIRVNAVAPGLIETEMLDSIPHLEEFKKRIPLGRLGTTDEVSGVVSFLCSKDAGYITGTTISVNGGMYPG